MFAFEELTIRFMTLIDTATQHSEDASRIEAYRAGILDAWREARLLNAIDKAELEEYRRANQ